MTGKHTPTLEQIREAATSYGRCCDLYQDGLGQFHCHECGQATFQMLRAVQALLGVNCKNGEPLSEDEHDKRYNYAVRVLTCVKAFHSPDREIATEQITEGLVWQLGDMLRDWQDEFCKRCCDREQNEHWEECDDARALLARLEPPK